ncbi:MAG: HDOD domain-containing protein [Bdellovibrionaceae bacterium]|nr:HDOD domain-containing protein [Pseudobdellovibrionaceae bacterium]
MRAAAAFDIQIYDRLDELPTLPAIVYELSKVISDPMSSTRDIENIMANDQSMTTKVLKLANSAYYAIPGGVSSLQRAIAYIGYDAIHQLVLSASIIEALAVKAPSNFDLNQFWKHAVGVGMASETIARFVHYKTPSDLFTAGLVHDIGKVATYLVAPDLLLQAIQRAAEKGLSLYEVEGEFGLPRHTQVGNLLASRWNLPSQIRAVVLHHHQADPQDRPALSSELNNVVDIVYLANLLMHALKFGHSGHEKVLGVPQKVLDRMYLDSEKLKVVIENIKVAITNADGFLKIIGG